MFLVQPISFWQLFLSRVWSVMTQLLFLLPYLIHKEMTPLSKVDESISIPPVLGRALTCLVDNQKWDIDMMKRVQGWCWCRDFDNVRVTDVSWCLLVSLSASGLGRALSRLCRAAEAGVTCCWGRVRPGQSVGLQSQLCTHQRHQWSHLTRVISEACHPDQCPRPPLLTPGHIPGQN